MKWLDASSKEAAQQNHHPTSDVTEAISPFNQSLAQVDTSFWTTLIEEKIE